MGNRSYQRRAKVSKRFWVRVSRRRELEFGIAFGKTRDWIEELTVISTRLSFGRYALVFVLRLKERK